MPAHQAPSGSYCLFRVGVRPHVLASVSTWSDSNECPSSVPVTMAWYSDSATLNARVVGVLDQCFTTVPLIVIIAPLVDILPVRVCQPESTRRSLFNSSVPRSLCWGSSNFPQEPGHFGAYLFRRVLHLRPLHVHVLQRRCQTPELRRAARPLDFVALLASNNFSSFEGSISTV